jgi:DNA polymerase
MTEGRAHESAAMESLAEVRAHVEGCQACPLWTTRTNAVFGGVDGHLDEPASLMILGEAPGAVEDRQGQPFLGGAGKELTRLLRTAELRRDQAYITNVVKCRPIMNKPGRALTNRPPDSTEIKACSRYLDAQISAVRPRLIIALGGTAVTRLLGPGAGVGLSRGSGRYQGIPVVATFHPSPLSLNRSPDRRHKLAEDLTRARRLLDDMRHQPG